MAVQVEFETARLYQDVAFGTGSGLFRLSPQIVSQNSPAELLDELNRPKAQRHFGDFFEQ